MILVILFFPGLYATLSNDDKTKCLALFYEDSTNFSQSTLIMIEQLKKDKTISDDRTELGNSVNFKLNKYIKAYVFIKTNDSWQYKLIKQKCLVDDKERCKELFNNSVLNNNLYFLENTDKINPNFFSSEYFYCLNEKAIRINTTNAFWIYFSIPLGLDILQNRFLNLPD